MRFNHGLTHTNLRLDFDRVLKKFILPEATRRGNIMSMSSASKSISVECLYLRTHFKRKIYLYMHLSQILKKMCVLLLDYYFAIISL